MCQSTHCNCRQLPPLVINVELVSTNEFEFESALLSSKERGRKTEGERERSGAEWSGARRQIKGRQLHNVCGVSERRTVEQNVLWVGVCVCVCTGI